MRTRKSIGIAFKNMFEKPLGVGNLLGELGFGDAVALDISQPRS